MPSQQPQHRQWSTNQLSANFQPTMYHDIKIIENKILVQIITFFQEHTIALLLK